MKSADGTDGGTLGKKEKISNYRIIFNAFATHFKSDPESIVERKNRSTAERRKRNKLLKIRSIR